MYFIYDPNLRCGHNIYIYILAIFTLSSGLSTCGSSDTKKMEKIAAYDLQKKTQFLLVCLPFENGSKTHAQIRCFKI